MTGETVLLVEDDETNSLLATAVLEAAGFRVEVATTAAEAERLLQSVLPHAILTRDPNGAHQCKIPVGYMSNPIKTWTFAQEVRELIAETRS